MKPKKIEKKPIYVAILIIIGITFSYSNILASDFYQNVINTQHNFATSPEDVCIICHTIKLDNAPVSTLTPSTSTSITGVDAATPIWDGTTTTDASFQLLATSRTFGSSIKCLECHDDILQNHSQGANNNGTYDGTNHPVGRTYPTLPNGTSVMSIPLKRFDRYWAVPDKQADHITIPSGPTSNYLQIPPDANPDDPLVVARLVRTTDGKVECDSCHDPHINTFAPFLRADPKKLCLVCHNR